MLHLEDVRQFVANHVSSALANHLGGVEVLEVVDDRIRLRMTHSCRTCYFRQGCIDNLVIPELHEAYGSDIKIVVR